MKNIMLPVSHWAHQHKWAARLFIVLGHLILIAIACYIGAMTRNLKIAFDSYWLTGSLVSAGVLGLFYPRYYFFRKNKGFYARQKRFDLGLLTVGFFAFIVESNREFVDVFSVEQAFAIHRTLDRNAIELDSCSSEKVTAMQQYMVGDEFQSLSKKEKKRYVKAQVKDFRESAPESNSGKAGLILLAILLGLVILWGTAALSCSLACSGASGMAVFVLILGVAGAIAAGIAIIRSGDKPKEEVQPGVISG